MISIDFEYINMNTPVDNFCCCGGIGCTELELFLKEEALEVQDQQIAYTVVALYNNEVAGYITYGIDSIKHEYHDARAVGVESHKGNAIPALRIYQPAIAEGYNRKGIGSQLIELLLQAFIELRQLVPCPQIIVAAYPDSVNFYMKFGFELASQSAQIWVTPMRLMFCAFPPDN